MSLCKECFHQMSRVKRKIEFREELKNADNNPFNHYASNISRCMHLINNNLPRLKNLIENEIGEHHTTSNTALVQVWMNNQIPTTYYSYNRKQRDL
jgi:hypothetical protein